MRSLSSVALRGSSYLPRLLASFYDVSRRASVLLLRLSGRIGLHRCLFVPVYFSVSILLSCLVPAAVLFGVQIPFLVGSSRVLCHMLLRV